MLKICFLSSMHPPRDKRVFDKEALTLVAAGYSVVHLCPDDGFQSFNEKGVQIVTYPRPSGIKGRLLQLIRLYRMAVQQDADCYHCNELDSWLLGVLLKILRKKRCVFDVHEHYPSTFAESRFPKWLQSFVANMIRLIFRVLLPFTDFIVLAKKTVSDDFPCHPSKKKLVRNFTPLSAVHIASSKKKPTPGDSLTLVHLGLFGRNRGWPQLLDAMHIMQHKNIFLKVIGEINDGTRSEFEHVARQYDLDKRISLFDWMPFEEAFEHLINAHVGLVIFQPGILNHVYAMPHKMFDYMAAGMAVICPDFAIEVAPIVQESGCGVVLDTSDSKAIARELDRLVENPDLVHDMGLKGQNAVLTRYNWEAEAVHLLDMYEQLDKNK